MEIYVLCFITSNFVVISGISNIKGVPKKDKDDLETLEIYYQFRLKEISSYNEYYLLEAFKIAFGDIEDNDSIHTDVTDEILNKKRKKAKFLSIDKDVFTLTSFEAD